MINNLMWIVSAFAVLGSVLNARRDIKGFYVWIATNILFVVYNIWLYAYAQAALFFVYTIIALWGVRQWRLKEVNSGHREA